MCLLGEVHLHRPETTRSQTWDYHGTKYSQFTWRYPSAHFRHALDIREHYERKLERANNLYMELNALMLQLELKERELLR